MKMWLMQATLAVLTVAAAAMAASSPTSVFLNNSKVEEERVEVPAGSNLTLYCCLEIENRAWITWYFQPSRNSSNFRQTLLPKKMINKSASTIVVECQESEKKYYLLDVNETHSGFYDCEVNVDIPRPHTFQSNKKEVFVVTNRMHPINPFASSMTAKSIVESTTAFVTREPVSPNTLKFEWWIWVLVGVSAFVLLVLIVVCILLRKCSNRSRAADPIYANTHCKSKDSSPRPEMNHLKTVSSTQNLRTPSPGQRYGEGKRRPRQ